jgi:dihydrofolate reductase
MRKLILQLAVSLDGYIEGPNGEFDWCFTDQDYGMSDFFRRIDSVFYGRKSYELAEAMPEPAEDSGMPAFPPLKQYVFSRTLAQVKPGAILISGDIEMEVNRVKNEPGKDIWLFGGANLTTSLLNLDLVDEISLAVHPVILGGGKPLFTGINNRLVLELLSSKSYSSGLVMLTYSLTKR